MEASEACRAIAYLTTCHRIEEVEKRCKSIETDPNMDLSKEKNDVETESLAFCRYLIKHATEVADWKHNRSLYTKWRDFSEEEKSIYMEMWSVC